MKKNAFKILAALCLCCQAGFALAGGFRMNWVESEVILDKDGKAQVSYTVRWTGTGGQLHGFYFEGFQETPVFDSAKAYAVDNAGKRYGLDIKRLSPAKYDIVLANGEAFSNGEITYFFRYACDLQASGNLTQTIADGRKLAVFNWSPVQWDDALEHEALVVRYPVELALAKVDDAVLAKLNFRTEKFVNERYMIDYPTVANAAGKYIFSTRFFRKNLDSRYHFQVQVYLDAAPFALDTMASGGLASPAPEKATLPPPAPGAAPVVTRFQPAEEKYYLNRYFPGSVLAGVPVGRGGTFVLLFLLIAAFALVPFLIMTVKHKAMLTAQAGISAVNWDGTEWTAPKAQVSSFRKSGKIAKDLTPLEAGLLLGVPLNELMGLMAANMQRKGLVKVEGYEPLRLSAVPGASAEDPYENSLLAALKPDGTLDAAAAQQVMRTLAAGVEQKAWDCDLEATRDYYKAQMEEKGRPDAQGRYNTGSDYGYYWGGYYGYHHHHHHPDYQPAVQAGTALKTALPAELSANFDTFRSSKMCYEGAFAANACHDACHSACHDACHSACVSSGH